MFAWLQKGAKRTQTRTDSDDDTELRQSFIYLLLHIIYYLVKNRGRKLKVVC